MTTTTTTKSEWVRKNEWEILLCGFYFFRHLFCRFVCCLKTILYTFLSLLLFLLFVPQNKDEFAGVRCVLFYYYKFHFCFHSFCGFIVSFFCCWEQEKSQYFYHLKLLTAVCFARICRREMNAFDRKNCSTSAFNEQTSVADASEHGRQGATANKVFFFYCKKKKKKIKGIHWKSQWKSKCWIGCTSIVEDRSAVVMFYSVASSKFFWGKTCALPFFFHLIRLQNQMKKERRKKKQQRAHDRNEN